MDELAALASCRLHLWWLTRPLARPGVRVFRDGLRAFLAADVRRQLRHVGIWGEGDRVDVRVTADGHAIIHWRHGSEELGVSLVVEGLGIEPDRSRGTSV